MSNAYFYSKLLLSAAFALAGTSSFAQGLTNNGAKINLINGAYLNIDGPDGNFTNTATAGAQVTNNQSFIEVEGNWTNNNTTGVFGAGPTASSGGTVVLDGDNQNIGGTEETNFFDLIVTDNNHAIDPGTDDPKTLTGTSNATGATVFGTVTLDDEHLILNTRTIENQDETTAFDQIGVGSVVSETGPDDGGYSVVRWDIGTPPTLVAPNSTDFVVPFGTGGYTNGDLIPFTYGVNTTGSAPSTYRTFATYPTDDVNTFATYAPYTVTHLTDDFGTDNGVSVIDRFWIIDEENIGVSAPDYSAQPTVYYTFTYSDDDFIGNSIAGSQLTPQRWNHDENKWLDWLYANPQFTNNFGGNELTMTIGADANTWEEDMYPVWTLVDNSDPLPIELVRFVGQCDGDNVTVRWTTWTETNNEFFTLERSINGVDFETVDIVDGAGNSNQPISYEITDYSSFPGTSYYRLKDTDTFGKEGYSSVIAVTCGEGSNEFNFVNAYEADQTDVVVEFTAENNEKFNVMLYDMTGRIALDYSGAAVSGMNKVRLPAGDLARGIYIINLNNEIKNFSRRVMLN